MMNPYAAHSRVTQALLSDQFPLRIHIRVNGLIDRYMERLCRQMRRHDAQSQSQQFLTRYAEFGQIRTEFGEAAIEWQMPWVNGST